MTSATPLADPLLIALEGARVERQDCDGAWLRCRLGNGKVQRSGHQQRDRPARDPSGGHASRASPAVVDVAVSRRRHLNGSSQLPSRANPPGPSRRSATSGIINNATSPTSHGQISMAIRDWRRPLRKASVGFSSAPPR
jgi:hypothetical protein